MWAWGEREGAEKAAFPRRSKSFTGCFTPSADGGKRARILHSFFSDLRGGRQEEFPRMLMDP
jgi:hypothetical protein